MTVQTFAADDVSLLIGAYVFSNIGADGVTVSRAEDASFVELGVFANSLAVSKNLRTNGTIDISVLTGSDDDIVCDQIASLSELKIFPVVLKVESISKAIATVGWYMGQPDLVLNTQAPSRTHKIGILNASFSIVDQAQSLLDQIPHANI
jgi:hypothetical protein